MAYYFLVASLPSLSLDEPVPISGAMFLETCAGFVSERDLADLRRIVEGEPELAEHPFARQWLERETLLRNEIAKARAAKLGVEAGPFLRRSEFHEPYTAVAVAEIIGGRSESREVKPGPAERELALDRYRWDLLDEMAVFAPFGIEPVFAFAFKLVMALRWAALEDEKGRESVNAFLEGAFVSL